MTRYNDFLTKLQDLDSDLTELVNGTQTTVSGAGKDPETLNPEEAAQLKTTWSSFSDNIKKAQKRHKAYVFQKAIGSRIDQTCLTSSTQRNFSLSVTVQNTQVDDEAASHSRSTARANGHNRLCTRPHTAEEVSKASNKALSSSQESS